MGVGESFLTDIETAKLYAHSKPGTVPVVVTLNTDLMKYGEKWGLLSYKKYKKLKGLRIPDQLYDCRECSSCLIAL